MSEGDVSGAVNILSSNDVILPPTQEVILELKTKHPSKPEDRSLPTFSDQTSLVFGRKDIIAAINSFKPGSAGGPDGLKPQHLKDITSEAL